MPICRRRFLAMLAAAAALPSASAAAFLPDAVARMLQKRRIARAQVGIVVRRLDDNASVIEHQAEKPFNPASVAKLVTALAAMDILGPNYQWKTTIAAAGEIANGVLNGDLCLVGGGDPLLTSERFLHILHDLRERDIRVVRGDVVIDDSFFAPSPRDPGAFDGAPLKPYNVGPGGMVVNFKATRVILEPAAGRVRVRLEPPNKHFSLINKTTLVSGKCGNWRGRLRERYRGDERQFQLALSGPYSKNCGEQGFYVSALSHAAYVAGVFGAFWERLGGEWGGKWRVGEAPKNARILAVHESPPLPTVLSAMNKHSNNVIARNVFLTLAGEPPRDENRARQAVGEWLRAQGAAGVVIDNGSGLSRKGRISAAQMSHLLETIWRHPHRADIVASLPILGLDGTLKRRLRQPPLKGEGRLKTGSLSNVKSLGGFFRDRDGRHYLLVIFAAGVSSARAKALQDDIIKWAYSAAWE